MRIDQLTFTRFIAALVIVILHFGKEIFPFNTEYIASMLLQTNVAVSYFFILSGFIMIISYGKYQHVDPADYFKNRFARIYPIYLLGLLLYLPIRIATHSIGFPFLFHLSALQSWVPGWAISYNFPGWSISVEMFFYAIFPFLANHVYKNKERHGLVVVCILAVWLGTQILFNYLLQTPYYQGEHTNSHELLFYFPLMHVNEFLIGNLAGLFYIKYNNLKPRNYDLAIIATVVLLVLALQFPFGLNYHNGLLGLVFIPFILFMSLNTGRITRLFCRKELVFLGEVSYGLYIYQLPIFYYGKKLLVDYPVSAFWISLLVLLIFSSLSYVYIEKPLRKKIRNFDLKTALKLNVK